MFTLPIIFLVLYIVGFVLFLIRNRNTTLDYLAELTIEWVLIGILGYVLFKGFI